MLKKKKILMKTILEYICLKKLSTFQIPNHIILVNQFSKLGLGKINKRQLIKKLI